MTPPFLFVYGTLRRGSANRFARLLAAHSRFLGTARIPGRLYNLGRYPGAVASGAPREWVAGEVFRMDHPGKLLPLLDAYEGARFERVRAPVRLSSGIALEAWVYLYRGNTPGQRIISGLWPRRG